MKKILILLLLFVSTACQKKEKKNPADVLVNIPPYAYFVQRIAGDTLHIETLIPQDACPHLYEPTPKQIESAGQTQIWFRLGEPQEKKILTILKEKNPTLIDIDLCYGISLISTRDDSCCVDKAHTHEGKDRHVWLSPKLARYQIKKIAKTLIERYPHYTERYLQNTAALIEELDLLNESLQLKLKPFKNQAILVSHPAFAYFCRDYKLLQLSVECDGKDPKPQDVAKTIQLAKRHHVRSVFIQMQYNNKGAELIAHDLGLPTHLVDPYAGDYLNNLLHISTLIAQ
ncbi:MAG: zinc ABC transporter substrate-binding protein [Chlamydiota bacterium]